MENKVRFDSEKAMQVIEAVCEQYGCNQRDVFGVKDTVFKKSVVYVLFKFYGFDWRLIGTHFQMTYLFVPTAADEIENMVLRVPGFRLKMIQVLKNIGYESTVDQRNALFVA